MNMYQDTVSQLCDSVTSPNRNTTAFINRVATGWVNMARKNHLTLFPDANVKDALQALANLIDNTAETIEDEPGTYLGEPLSLNGAFKECYEWTPDYVIKFCSKRNPTLDEINVLLDAKEYGVDHFFVPSFYAPLPRLINLPHLDKDDDESEVYVEGEGWVPNPEWEDNTPASYICIQPRIQPLGDTDENARAFSNHQKDWAEMTRIVPQLAGEDRKDWYILSGACLVWVAQFGHYYGKDGLLKLRDFCETFGIWDLHADNVGHFIPKVSGYNAPVILDWMSRS